MDEKLSFKQYYEAKQKLLEQSSSSVSFKTTHVLHKYCKVPLLLEEIKHYISFKPKDRITIHWNRNASEITPICIELNEKTLTPSWNGRKMKTWVETSTFQIVKDD